MRLQSNKSSAEIALADVELPAGNSLTIGRGERRVARRQLGCKARRSTALACVCTRPHRALVAVTEKLRIPLLCSRPEEFVPGVDFRAVREMISMSDVLELIGHTPSALSGDVLRGPCPVHRSKSSRSRSFAVNLKRNVYRCFTCGSAGNHLDLYVAVTQKRVFEAAVELCDKLHRPVPWLQSTTSRPKNLKIS